MGGMGAMRERRVVTIEGGAPPLVVDVYDAERPRGAVICVHGFAAGRRGGMVARDRVSTV